MVRATILPAVSRQGYYRQAARIAGAQPPCARPIASAERWADAPAAILAVDAGGRVVEADAAAAVALGLTPRRSGRALTDLELGERPLSDRELEVLRLAAEGNSGPRIADLLCISPTTVKTHFDHIYEKLGVSDRAAAVAHGVRTGLIR